LRRARRAAPSSSARSTLSRTTSGANGLVRKSNAPSLSARQLGNEVGVRAADRTAFGRWLWLMRARWFVVLGWFLMRFGLKTEQTDWSTYKETLFRNTDVRKFNDVYRQILAGKPAQREALDAWLAAGFPVESRRR